MRVIESQLNAQAAHQASQKRTVRESLRTWVGDRRPDFERLSGNAGNSATQVQISAPARAIQTAETGADQSATAIKKTSEEIANDPKLQLLKAMIERLTGQKIKLFSNEEFTVKAEHITTDTASPQRRAGFGVEYEYHEVYEESEITQFAATGVVKTADGKEIEFSVQFALQRSYRETLDISVRIGDPPKKDPLVINFSGNAAQLTDQRFRFDLEGDGTQEEIPLLASGSGYLVLDKNGNGKVDNGKELFGPATGQGFNELAAYDQDGNRWIDENDAVYKQLRLWQPSSNDPARLLNLQEAQVGAISLAHLATPFSLKDAQNQSLGEVRSTSVYLKEGGGAGTVQQIDLSV